MIYTGMDSIDKSHPLRRLHPLTRFVFFAFLCFAAYIFEGWFVLGAIFAVVLFLRVLGKGRVQDVLFILRMLVPFFALIVVINLLLVSRERPVSWRLLYGLRQCVRIALVIVAFKVFLTITSPLELSDLFLSLFRPLRRIGVRVEEMSLVVMVTFSFIPLFFIESERIRLAQAVRGGFKEGFGMVRQVVPLLVPLVIGIFRRAEEIEYALKVRYFQQRHIYSAAERQPFVLLDFLVIAASVALFVAGTYAKL